MTYHHLYLILTYGKMQTIYVPVSTCMAWSCLLVQLHWTEAGWVYMWVFEHTLPLTRHAFCFAQCNQPLLQTCCVLTFASLVIAHPAVVTSPLWAHETVAHICFITDTCFITWPCGSKLHTRTFLCAVYILFFCVKLSAIRAFSTFAFGLDFIRSSSFSLSSQSAKAQSLSAVARLHDHESFWNVLDFTHQNENNGLCIAEAVDPSFFFSILCLIFVASKSFCRHNPVRNSAQCAAGCSFGVLGCNLAHIWAGQASTACPCQTASMQLWHFHLLLLYLLWFLQMCNAVAIAAPPFPILEGVVLRWLVRGSRESCK